MITLKKAFEIVKKLTPKDDKLGHSYVGNWIYLISFIVIYISFYFIFEDEHLIEIAIFSLVITLIAAYKREKYNEKEEGNKWSWWDIFFTILFPFITTVLIIIIIKTI